MFTQVGESNDVSSQNGLGYISNRGTKLWSTPSDKEILVSRKAQAHFPKFLLWIQLKIALHKFIKLKILHFRIFYKLQFTSLTNQRIIFILHANYVIVNFVTHSLMIRSYDITQHIFIFKLTFLAKNFKL